MKHVSVQYHDMEHKDCKYWQFYYEEELSDPEILDIVWEQWNAGSGNESEEFLKRNVRSMMVGDYICIDGVWHECLPFGWRIDVPWEEVMGDAPKYKKGHELTKDEIAKKLIKQLGLDSDIQVRVE